MILVGFYFGYDVEWCMVVDEVWFEVVIWKQVLGIQCLCTFLRWLKNTLFALWCILWRKLSHVEPRYQHHSFLHTFENIAQIYSKRTCKIMKFYKFVDLEKIPKMKKGILQFGYRTRKLWPVQVGSRNCLRNNVRFRFSIAFSPRINLALTPIYCKIS